MGFWDNVNDELKKAVEEGWSAVKESAKIGKLRLRAHSLHKNAEKHFAGIGGIVYEMSGIPLENPLNKPEVQKHIEEIKKIQAETEVIEKEIEKLKSKERAAGGAR
ncbi:MAG: hypothetical protein HY954_06050 [Deltaproteobacteria bacterium]|nr:hypothetical protein [Deltaproteobacteria bacterium]